MAICLTLLENPKRPIELGNSNTCAEVKLCFIFIIPAQEIVCGEIEVLNIVNSG